MIAWWYCMIWLDGMLLGVYEMLLCWFGGIIGLLHERTVVGIGFLAQASMSRLGEINGSSPKLLYARSRSGDLRYFERVCASLRREGSRLSEIPLKFTIPLFEPSPRRRELAWARPFSLSEELGESSVMFDRFLESWMVNTCLDLSIVLKAWDKWLCMSNVTHDLWMMGLVWT